MKKVLITLLALSSVAFGQNNYVPEEGSVEESKKKGRKSKVDKDLPMVLTLGDSISMGYTGGVKKALKGKANVIHNPGNSQGTTHTKANVDKWLKIQKWDVIHFNLGLHDLKRVKEAGTSKNSDDPNDPFQADLASYSTNMQEIVGKLKASGAKLIFATTTPYPAGVSPYRDPADPAKYNAAAVAIMKKNDIPVNDLYALVLPQLDKIQKPKNVHFKPEGSALLAKQVTEKISAVLPKK